MKNLLLLNSVTNFSLHNQDNYIFDIMVEKIIPVKYLNKKLRKSRTRKKKSYVYNSILRKR